MAVGETKKKYVGELTALQRESVPEVSRLAPPILDLCPLNGPAGRGQDRFFPR